MRHLHKAQAGRQRQHTEATFLPEPEPRARHYTIISVDDHLIEPAHVFEGRVPGARSPTARRTSSRSTTAARRGCTKTASTRRSGSTRSPAARRPSGAWSPRASTRCGAVATTSRRASHDMDLDGVYATLCFPSLIAGFAGTIFANSKDPELGLACLRAWNDWHIDEWAGPHPDRIIPLQLAWLHDPGDRGRRRAPQRRARLQGGELPGEPGRPRRCRRCTPTTGTRSCARARRRRPSCACTTARRRGPRPARPARRSSSTRRCSR